MLVAVPVAASISQPDVIQIQDIQAYQSVRVDNDQLYIVRYYLEYGTNPDDSAEDLFMFRLLDATEDEIAITSPYAFYDSGYGLGVVAFYLDPDVAPTWESTVYVEFTGDPLEDWSGGSPPSVTTDGITFNDYEGDELLNMVSSHIIILASALEQSWTVEMITTTQGITILSDTGAAYFLRAVPYLRDVAPYAIGSYSFDPEYPTDRPVTNDYAEELETAIDGSPLDIRFLQYETGIERKYLIGGFYYSFVVILFIILIRKHKLNKGVTFFGYLCVVIGAFIGAGLELTLVGAFMCLLMTGWVFIKGT